jgi:hypothetical protein
VYLASVTRIVVKTRVFGDTLSVYHLIWRYRKEIDEVLPFLEHMTNDGQPTYSQFQRIQQKVRCTSRIPVYYKLISLLYSKDNESREISELEYQDMVTDLQPILNGLQSPSTSYIMYMNLVQAYVHTLYSSRHATVTAGKRERERKQTEQKDHPHPHSYLIARHNNVEDLLLTNYYILCTVLSILFILTTLLVGLVAKYNPLGLGC